MLKKPTTKQLSTEAMQSIISASSQQTGKVVRQKTYDPNYPVFEIPINKRVLIYIPNHTSMTPEGIVDIRKDKFAGHSCQEGRSYHVIRCNAGIIDESLGLDGSCPFCDANVEVWDLYNKQYREIAKSKGIDVDSPEAKEGLKQVRIDLLNKQAVKPGEVYYTFPIVVIDCEEENGKATTKPKKGADGSLSYKIMWYTVKERVYLEKWVKAFETVSGVDDITPTHPAGLWAVLNFEYESKTGKHDKMSSARNLNVGFKTMHESYNQWASVFDDLTKDWTPAKAMETLVDNVLRDGQEQQEAADTILKSTRDSLAMLALGGSVQEPIVAGSSVANAGSALASFGATPTPETSVGVGEIPQVGVN